MLLFMFQYCAHSGADPVFPAQDLDLPAQTQIDVYVGRGKNTVAHCYRPYES